jgi:hypothetical protein
VTSNPVAKGQLTEAEYMQKHNFFFRQDKIVLPLIVGRRISPPSPKEGIPAELIYRKCAKLDFYQAMEDIGNILSEVCIS